MGAGEAWGGLGLTGTFTVGTISLQWCDLTSGHFDVPELREQAVNPLEDGSC